MLDVQGQSHWPISLQRQSHKAQDSTADLHLPCPHSSLHRRIMENICPPLLSGTARPAISYLKESRCRKAGSRTPGRSAVERTERRMAATREVSRYHSQQLRIFV